VYRQKATFRQEKSPGTSGRGLTQNVGFQCRNTLWILAKPKSFENQEQVSPNVLFGLSQPNDHAMTGFSIVRAKPVTRF
jgi:hypothetical protein